MIIGNLQDILSKMREDLLVMFLIKNAEGKYLITSNNYFNFMSLPCKHIEGLTPEETQEAIELFLNKEFDFVGVLNQYVETVRTVAKIKGEIKICNIACFELKPDEDLKSAVERKVRFSPSEEYATKQYVTLNELKIKYWNKEIDENTMFFSLRAKDSLTPANIDLDIFNTVLP